MNSNKFLLFILLLFACLSQFASDIYLPAVPHMATILGAQIKWIQLSMAIYMLGLALSPLVYGPLSEGYGRKKPLVAGLIIMLIGSLLCVYASSVELLIVGRLISGLGAGACITMFRAVFRDTYKGAELAKYGSYLSMLVVFIYPTAPMIGAYLLHDFGWRSIFICIAGYALLCLILVTTALKETNVHFHKDRLKLSYITSTYKQFFKHQLFIGTAAATFLTFGGFFSWLIVSPVLLIHVAKLNPVTYGWMIFLGSAVVFALGGQINGKLVKKLGVKKLLRFGWSCTVLSGLLLLLGYWILGIHVWSIYLAFLIFYFGTAFIWSNANATALTPFGKTAGYAGALYGGIQVGGGAVIGAVMSHLSSLTPTPLALVVIGCSTAAWVCYEVFVRTAISSTKENNARNAQASPPTGRPGLGSKL